MARVRISNSSLNDRGTRVITAGLDIAQYQRNPVVLYMHQRGDIIGYMKDVKKEGDDVTGEPVFDEASELSKKCKKQFEVGSLRMVSAGIEILGWSEEPEFLLDGQERPSVIKSVLHEVSFVDIGSNNDAIRFTYKGSELKLAAGIDCPELPLIKNISHTNKKTEIMELKALALSLGLPETATEEEINKKVVELRGKESQMEALQKQNEELALESIKTIVQNGVSSKKIADADKEQFIELGKKVGAEELTKLIGKMNPAVKISDTLNLGASGSEGKSEFKKLSEVPSEQIAEMREKNLTLYKRLYKAEYGVECEIED